MLLTTARAAADLLGASFQGREGERIAVIHLDSAQRVLSVSEADGAPDSAELPIGIIAADALRLGTVAIVLAHNHPSGDPRPSDADLIATRRLLEALAPIGVDLHDHLIFAGARCSSFRAIGLL